MEHAMNKTVPSSKYPTELSVTTPSGSKTYVLEGLLGEGAYNTAYLAYEKRSPQKKFVYKRYKVGQEKNNHEVTILSTINSRDITAPTVKIIDRDVVDSDGKRGHTEGLAQGQKISQQKPSSSQALILAIHFARLLKTCAEADISYRDVKPFDHVFWEMDESDGVKSITVIDWNIARLPASIGDIYFDFVKFCQCLPEFFMGKRPSKREHYHPLSWRYDEEVQKTVSPVLWLMLSSISLNFSCPSIPDGEKLLEIGNLNKETIVRAWDRIIYVLSSTLKMFENKEISSLHVEDFPEEFRLILIQWLHEPTSAQLQGWLNEHLYNWLGKFDIESPTRLLIDEKDRVLGRLRVAHIVSGGSFRETILFSLFLAIYRTGLFKDGSAPKLYEKIIKDLLNGQPASSIYNEKSFDTLASLARQQASSDDHDLRTLSGQIWEDIGKEFKAWIICDAYDSAKTLEEKEQLLGDLDTQHPRYEKYKKNLKLQLGQKYQLSDLYQNIEKGNFTYAEELSGSFFDSAEVKKIDIEELISFCKHLNAIIGKDGVEINISEAEGLVRKMPVLELPASYQTQLENLKGKLPELRKIDSLHGELEGVSEVIEFERLYGMIESQFSGQTAADAKTMWNENFEKYAREKIEYFKVVQAANRVEDLSKLEFIKPELEQLLRLSRESGLQALENILSTSLNDVQATIVELEEKKRELASSFAENYKLLLLDAGNRPGKFQEIIEMLSAPENISSLDKDWLNAEKEKVAVLYTAAEILRDVRGIEKKEWQIADTVSKLPGVLSRLSDYSEGKSLSEQLSAFQGEFDVRQKTLNMIEQVRQLQDSSFSEIKNEISERDKNIEEKYLRLEKKMNVFGRLTSFFLVVLLVVSVLNFFRAGQLGGFSMALGETPTAIDSENLFDSTQTSMPTVVPTFTFTPEPTPEPTSEPLIVKAVLATGATFYGDDQKTTLWVFSNPSSLSDISVDIVEQGEIYSLVRLQAVVGTQFVDPDTLSIKQSSVNIRVIKEGIEPPVIGYNLSVFTVEKNGELIDGLYQPVIIQGWVENKFLIEIQP